MSNAVRLEQLLRFWEDAVFRDVISVRFDERIGMPVMVRPPREYRHIRRMLLAANDQKFDTEGYLPTGSYTPCDLDPVPFLLYQWCKSSRKVYHLGDEFRELLNQTSFEDLERDEIRLPFKAIAVSLETPIQDVASGTQFDAFVLWEATDGVAIQLLPRALGERKPMNREERDRLATNAAAAVRGSVRQRAKVATRLVSLAEQYAELRTPFGICRISGPPGATCTNGSLIEAFRRSNLHFGECLAEAFRIGVGLAFYLSQPKGEGHESVRSERLPATPDPTAITSEVDVCFIDVCEKMVVPEPLAEREPCEPHGPHGTSPCAHWRTGYWRRRPGEGNDPNAPRVVWVRPTRVRKDRLAEGELPAGKKYEL